MPDGIYGLRDPSSGLPAFNMNNEFNLFGCKTSLTGRLQECFPVIDDEPLAKAVVKSAADKNKGVGSSIIEAVASAAMAACAVVIKPAIMAGVELIGPLVGAGAVVAAITDIKISGQSRSLGDIINKVWSGVVHRVAVGAAAYSQVVKENNSTEGTGNTEKKLLAYEQDLLNMKNSDNILDKAKYLGKYFWDRWPGLWGEINEQNALISGVDPEWAEAYGVVSSTILVDAFSSVAMKGAKAIKEACKTPKGSNVVEGTSSTRPYTKSSLKMGQEMHKAYKADVVDNITKFKEFRLPSGKRIDFIDFETKTIYELKPYNPNGIKTGLKQLEVYLKEVESIYGGGWKTILDTY